MILEAAALYCLTQLVYFEARSEDAQAQRNVVYTALNRLHHSRWPNTACEVVRQKHQYTFYWDGKPERVHEPEAWKAAQQSVKDALQFYHVENSGFTHYHHHSIPAPYWVASMTGATRIGAHVFYYEKERR